MKSLLDLPVEILGLVLAETTPAAFLQTAYTCSALLSFAANNRLLLLHHLQQVPGKIDFEWTNLETSDLFRLLFRRALLCLVPGFQVQQREFAFDGSLINAQIHRFFERDGSLSLALASKASNNVTIYSLGADQPRIRRVLDVSYGVRTPSHALCMAVGAEGVTIYVLEEWRSADDDCCYSNEIKDDLRFSIVALNVDEGQRIWQFFPSSPSKNHRPLSMAVAGDGTIAISWQHINDVTDSHVALYTDAKYYSDSRQRKGLTLTGTPVFSEEGVNANLRYYGPFTELRFNDNDTQLLYWRAASAIYHYYQKLGNSDIEPRLRLFRNSSPATISEWELPTKIATPFFCTHSQRQTNFMLTNCHWNYLAVGTAEHRRTHETKAIIVRAEARCRSQNCNHTPNLDRGRRLPHWQCVAELEGYNDVAHLGLLKSISYARSGRRLAFASGNTICVWSLIPDDVIKGPQDNNRDYRDHDLRRGIVCLKPDIIELSQEIMKHEFLEDNKLLVLTANGVVYLKLGSLVKSHARTPLEIPCEDGNLADESDTASMDTNELKAS